MLGNDLCVILSLSRSSHAVRCMREYSCCSGNSSSGSRNGNVIDGIDVVAAATCHFIC